MFRRLTAIMLGFVTLASATNFEIGLHFCMGKIENVALFAKAEKCNEELIALKCSKNNFMPCCDDETIIHKADELKIKSWDGPSIFSKAQVSATFTLLSEVIPVSHLSRIRRDTYLPPVRSPDLIIEYQVFLI